MFAEHLGYDVPEELHHELKRKFLAVDPDAALVKMRSTADLTDAEFREYVEQVRRLAAEYGCPIDGPMRLILMEGMDTALPHKRALAGALRFLAQNRACPSAKQLLKRHW